MAKNSIQIIALSFLIAMTSCGEPPVRVVYRSEHVFSDDDRRAIASIARSTARDVRKLLPMLPPTFSVFVDTSDRVIPETGETGSVSMPSGVYWAVNPKHEGGVKAIVDNQLRPTLFHELYHAVRETAVPTRSLRDFAVNEGLATVFERDFGAGKVPWGEYPPEVLQWTTEFLALPENADRHQWMTRHADGRRWIGYRVGTYLAERAVRVSGLPVTGLATTPTEQIIAWAVQ